MSTQKERQSYVLVTAPATEPLTVAEVKLHLRIDHADEDSLLDLLIITAREYAERVTRRSLLPQVWRLVMDDFPFGYYGLSNLQSNPRYSGYPGLSNDPIYFEHGPIIDLINLKYIDQLGAQQTVTFPDTNYIFDNASLVPRLVPGYTKFWPLTQSRINAVEIQYNAGYATAAAVPKKIRQAMLLLIGMWYQHREDIGNGKTGFQSMQSGFADALLWTERTMTL